MENYLDKGFKMAKKKKREFSPSGRVLNKLKYKKGAKNFNVPDYLQDVVDFDYLHLLSDEERKWLENYVSAMDVGNYGNAEMIGIDPDDPSKPMKGVSSAKEARMNDSLRPFTPRDDSGKKIKGMAAKRRTVDVDQEGLSDFLGKYLESQQRSVEDITKPDYMPIDPRTLEPADDVTITRKGDVLEMWISSNGKKFKRVVEVSYFYDMSEEQILASFRNILFNPDIRSKILK